MFEFTQIASAFLTESKLDLKSAKLLFENGIYSRAIYFAHQSSEKAIWIPSGEYNEDDAREAIRKADFILNSLMEFIVSNLGNYPEK